MNPNTELRRYLLETYQDKGYVVFRLPPNGDAKGLDDVIRVNSPRQFFVGRDYMAVPHDFAQREPIHVLEEMMGR